ncbi:hypothetical protein [Brevundimonas sp. Leaf363]|uniref:hypothetical protein n=1 Tax=Brevundimonas sp. Leaf363 TaxID=1736353 RepID=UPI00138F8B77|nr:hypothetical protein [Brevundimonas sp. Leaf363]
MRANQFLDLMLQAVANDTARGTVVIIDTVKKFANLMDKNSSSTLGDVCRQYVLAGGTVVGLGHTRKNPKADGTPQYQGTTDILEDFDAVYIAQVMKPKAGGEA